MRVALTLEYDGSRFCGWQSQPDGCGAQDALEAALGAIAGQTPRVHAAGRTDAGVHALAQVAHFDTPAERPESAWVRGVNAHLPAGMAVLAAQPVGEDFHARYAATERRYLYLLLNHPVRPALHAARAGWCHQPLDLAAMAEAAACLPGEHDFSAFRAAECQARSPVRELRLARVDARGPWIRFEFRANAFLHHMVRNMVGALVWVGQGRRGPAWVAELLASRDRRLGPPTFAPDGLYFAGAAYPPELGFRAAAPRWPEAADSPP